MERYIFDLDGTLLDSMEAWEEMDVEFLGSRGINVTPEIENQVKTMTLLQAAIYFKRSFDFPEPPQELMRQMHDRILKKYLEDLPLKKGTELFLRQAYTRGAKMCVVTASERACAVGALSRLGILDLFEFVMTCSEESMDKNSPEIYLAAAARLGGREGTIVFEDALHAAQAAKCAGFPVVGVSEKKGDSKDSMLAVCDLYICDFKEFDRSQIVKKT